MPKFTGESVEQAIQIGLKSLQLNEHEVEIQVIEEGKKGFLGFGRREAVIEIKQKDTSDLKPLPVSDKIPAADSEDKQLKSEETLGQKELKDLTEEQAIIELSLYLTNISKELGAPAMVKIKRMDGRLMFLLETEKKGLLIGKHGRVLNAVQYLAQVYIHRIAKERLVIVVNVGDYRERREAIIKRLAKQTLRKVRETGQPVFLEPMPAFERKQVHSLLASEADIKTHSEGNEPHRYLVVESKK